MTNTIRPCVATSLRIQGEVQTWIETRKSVTLGGQQRSDGRARQVFGDGMHGRSCGVKQGDLLANRDGVHARGGEEPGEQESEHP